MSRADVVALERQPEEPDDSSEHDEVEEGSDVEFELDAEPEKSEGEEELERLVFGDTAGFKENLKSSALAKAESEDSDDGITGLEGLDDADVGQAFKTSRWPY